MNSLIEELIIKKKAIAYRIIKGDFKSKIPFEVTKKRIDKIFRIKGKRYETHKIIDSNFTYSDNKWIRNLFNHECFNCGSKKNLQIDHHMPLSMGYGLKIGEDYNAVLLCKKCNNKKSNLHPIKFYTPSQLRDLEMTYHIRTHRDDNITPHENIHIEKLTLDYENSLKENNSIYLDYLTYLWSEKKLSKYRLKKGNLYKIYYLKDEGIEMIDGKIKYNFFLGKIYINNLKIRLIDVKGVVLWE